MSVEFEIDFDEDLMDYVDLDIDEAIKCAVLAHRVTKDLTEVETMIEDVFELGPEQAEQFFDTFRGVILALSEHMDQPLEALLDATIAKFKSGEIKAIEGI